MRTKQQAMADAIKSGAVQAWIDGKTIEVKSVKDTKWSKFAPGDPDFTSEQWEWRIKHEPNLRPWKPSEVPHLAKFRRKSWPPAEYSTIVGFGEGGIEFTTGAGCDEVRLDNAFEHFLHSTDGGKTWHPCGVMEGGE